VAWRPAARRPAAWYHPGPRLVACRRAVRGHAGSGYVVRGHAAPSHAGQPARNRSLAAGREHGIPPYRGYSGLVARAGRAFVAWVPCRPAASGRCPIRVAGRTAAWGRWLDPVLVRGEARVADGAGRAGTRYRGRCRRNPALVGKDPVGRHAKGEGDLSRHPRDHLSSPYSSLFYPCRCLGCGSGASDHAPWGDRTRDRPPNSVKLPYVLEPDSSP
jgi:hypothetical protein